MEGASLHAALGAAAEAIAAALDRHEGRPSLRDRTAAAVSVIAAPH